MKESADHSTSQYEFTYCSSCKQCKRKHYGSHIRATSRLQRLAFS